MCKSMTLDRFDRLVARDFEDEAIRLAIRNALVEKADMAMMLCAAADHLERGGHRAATILNFLKRDEKSTGSSLRRCDHAWEVKANGDMTCSRCGDVFTRDDAEHAATGE